MASNINPGNIDGTYPIPGQQNDSQGFRNNFTNTKSNFTAAQSEITDLQNKVILKAPLTGYGSVNNNMTGVPILGAATSGFTQSFAALVQSSPNVQIVTSVGDVQKFDSTGPIVLSFTGFPATGVYASVRVWIKITDVAHTITFPSTATVGLNELLGVSGFVLTPPLVGDYIFDVGTSDGATTLVVSLVTGPGADVSSIDAIISTFVAEVSIVQGNIATLTSDYGNISSDVSTLVSTMSNLQGANITLLATELVGLTSNVSTLQTTAVVNDKPNQLHGNVIAGATQSVSSLGSVASTATLNYAVADFFSMVTTVPLTLSFSNWPTGNVYSKLRAQITVTNAGDNITFPPEVSIGLNKVGSTSGQILVPVIGDYLLEFSTINGGATVMVAPLITP